MVVIFLVPKKVENFTVTLVHATEHDSAGLVMHIQWKASSVAMHLRILLCIAHKIYVSVCTACVIQMMISYRPRLTHYLVRHNDTVDHSIAVLTVDRTQHNLTINSTTSDTVFVEITPFNTLGAGIPSTSIIISMENVPLFHQNCTIFAIGTCTMHDVILSG